MSDAKMPAYDPMTIYRAAFWPSGANELAYRAAMVNQAIDADNVDWLREALGLGFITKETKTFDESPIARYCAYKKADKCAALLRQAGFPG